jgi:hypothetical protein
MSHLDPRRRKGTPTKRQVSKRQVSKRPVSKCLKRQVYKTSALQNVRFTKRQVYKTSGLQNVLLQKNIHLYSVLVGGGNPQVLLRHVCRQSDGCVLFSILEGFLPYITIITSNKLSDSYPAFFLLIATTSNKNF